MVTKVNFTKMHGCGNDFILIDHINPYIQEKDKPNLVKTICERKFNIGANGLMFIEKSSQADFKMRYFNADGSEGEMCGNGARCIAKFAFDQGIANKLMTIETLDGIYHASILDNNQVRLSFPSIPLSDFRLNQCVNLQNNSYSYHYVWAGVPHVVVEGNHILTLSDIDFASWAVELKEQKMFQPEGTNINLIEEITPTHFHIRTFERGVEEETLACGSGATASALIVSLLRNESSPIQMRTRGGDVLIHFNKSNRQIEEITLTGNAITVFEGMFKWGSDRNEE